MDEINQLLKTFRDEVISQYIAKGIRPPKPDSAEELEIFRQWLKGRELLEEKK